jgi:hypothetical protein
MTTRTAPAAKAVAHVHAVQLDDSHKTTLFMWRLLSIGLAIVLSVAMKRYEESGLIALFGEHLGEVVEYVGVWFGRLDL